MNWKTFLQIALLMILTGIIFYLVYPKYGYFMEGTRYNKITGDSFYGSNGR